MASQERNSAWQDESEQLIILIDGVRFEENHWHDIPNFGFARVKLESSPGPLISDVVTHEKDFQYSTAGIHIGQDDRLTFLSPVPKVIQATLIDYREGSSTFGSKNVLRFTTSHKRRLVIPRGVAHTFSNLEGVVTRDEPIWYVDTKNGDYDITNDLISVPINKIPDKTDAVRVNKVMLSSEGHEAMSGIQQIQLAESRSYLMRLRVNIAGEERYISLTDKTWGDSEKLLNEAIDNINIKSSQLKCFRNHFAYTGKDSHTIVPSPEADQICDFLIGIEGDLNFKIHLATDLYLTFLSHEGDIVRIESCDLNVQNDRLVKIIEFQSDPRICFKIPRGVAYRVRCAKTAIVRSQVKQYFVKGGENPIVGLQADGFYVSELELMSLKISLEDVGHNQVPELLRKRIVQLDSHLNKGEKK